MRVFDIVSLCGRLLPRLTRVVVIVALLFLPNVAVGIVLQAGREEGARFTVAIHEMLRRELSRAHRQRVGQATSGRHGT